MDAECVYAVMDPQTPAQQAELLLVRMRAQLPDGPVQLTVRLPDDPLNIWPGQLSLIMHRA
jgi:hypothetical protein